MVRAYNSIGIYWNLLVLHDCNQFINYDFFGPKNSVKWSNPNVPVPISEIQNYIDKNLRRSTLTPILLIPGMLRVFRKLKKLAFKVVGRGLENDFYLIYTVKSSENGQNLTLAVLITLYGIVHANFAPLSQKKSSRNLFKLSLDENLFKLSLDDGILSPCRGDCREPKYWHFWPSLSLKHQFCTLNFLNTFLADKVALWPREKYSKRPSSLILL